mgnify:CR=1 FL=1
MFEFYKKLTIILPVDLVKWLRLNQGSRKISLIDGKGKDNYEKCIFLYMNSVYKTFYCVYLLYIIKNTRLVFG